MGPKDIDILRKVNPKLGTIVDWGFFGVLAKPLFLSLNWVQDHWTGNYGWAIILVTLIINLALFPLRLTSLKSARKMQKLQPQIQAINAKYKNISMRDPKKAEQNQEVMALYKKEGVNPVGGCLPMMIQLPVLLRVLPRPEHRDRTAARALALGARSFRARNAADPPAADHPDRHPVLFAKADAGCRRRPESAENDDAHAADVRLHVLLRCPRDLYYIS